MFSFFLTMKARPAQRRCSENTARCEGEMRPPSPPFMPGCAPGGPTAPPHCPARAQPCAWTPRLSPLPFPRGCLTRWGVWRQPSPSLRTLLSAPVINTGAGNKRVAGKARCALGWGGPGGFPRAPSSAAPGPAWGRVSRTHGLPFESPWTWQLGAPSSPGHMGPGRDSCPHLPEHRLAVSGPGAHGSAGQLASPVSGECGKGLPPGAPSQRSAGLRGGEGRALLVVLLWDPARPSLVPCARVVCGTMDPGQACEHTHQPFMSRAPARCLH